MDVGNAVDTSSSSQEFAMVVVIEDFSAMCENRVTFINSKYTH